MRISDWSSDVCSSDLEPIAMRHMPRTLSSAAAAALLVTSVASPADARRYRHHDRGVDLGDLIVGAVIIGGIAVLASEIGKARDKDRTIFGGDRNRGRDTESAAVSACTDAAEIRASQSGRRSEEHTSELQSLMRISYAVFCLKKKKKTANNKKRE